MLVVDEGWTVLLASNSKSTSIEGYGRLEELKCVSSYMQAHPELVLHYRLQSFLLDK